MIESRPILSGTIAAGPDEALVAAIIGECRKRNDGTLGRKAIQKICYFAQALGVPLGYRFRIYYYGPYSDGLASAIDMMLIDGILTESTADRDRQSNYFPGPGAGELQRAHAELLARHAPMITQVADTFGTLDPQTLELLSTVHFVDRWLKAAGHEHPPKDLVLRQFEQEKPDKFPRWRVEKGYDALRQAGLVG